MFGTWEKNECEWTSCCVVLKIMGLRWKPTKVWLVSKYFGGGLEHVSKSPVVLKFWVGFEHVSKSPLNSFSLWVQIIGANCFVFPEQCHNFIETSEYFCYFSLLQLVIIGFLGIVI